MRIEIINNRPGTWYENKLGEVYESSRENNDGTGYICDKLTLNSPGRMSKYFYVIKEDARIVGSLKLAQIPSDLEAALKKINMDEDIAMLGFKCKGQLCEFEGYGNFYERLWVWMKVVDNDVYIAVTADAGNTYCSLAYTDKYIKELIKEM